MGLDEDIFLLENEVEKQQEERDKVVILCLKINLMNRKKWSIN